MPRPLRYRPGETSPCPFSRRSPSAAAYYVARQRLVLVYPMLEVPSALWELKRDDLQASLLDPRPGEALTLQLSTPASPMMPFLMMLSGGSWPGLPFRDAYGLGQEVIPVDNDRILGISLGFGWWGVTSGAGAGSVSFTLPNDPTLIWSRFHAAAIVLDTSPLGIRSVADGVKIQVIP